MVKKRDKKPIEIDPVDAEKIKEIGAKLKQLRKQKESNYEVFAFNNNINRVSLYRVENGKGNFTLNTLLKVLRALEITPEDFFKGIK